MAFSTRPTARTRSRRRNRNVGMPPVRVVTAERSSPRRSERKGPRAATPAPRRTVRATRRAYFELYAPRITLNPWLTKRDWRASRPKFFAALLVVVISLALYQLFNADTFFVSDITVQGNRLVTQDEVGRAAAIRGWNILFINPHEVELALEQLPEIKSVLVTMLLPNVVQAQVVERVPRLAWTSGSATYWVDDDGIALRVRGNLPGLLTLRDGDNAPVKIGARVNADAFNAAVSLRNAWQNGPRAFEWSHAHGLAIHDEHGTLIYLGSASQMADKLSALKIVSDQIRKDNRPVAFIDLGNGLPYYQEVAAQKPAGSSQ